MADTNTFSASAVGLMVPGGASEAHQGYVASAASLPGGGIKGGGYRESSGE